LGFRDHFKDILYSARIGHPKGAPAFFAGINAMLGIRAHESPLFFDDSEEVVRLAREAGWDACVFDGVRTVATHPRLQPLLGSQRV
jgi:putative hydrolase of the HAD superfamily